MNRMERRRKELNLSQREVARRAGLSERGYTYIVTGKRPHVRFTSLQALATALECKVEDIWPLQEESA